MITSNETAPRRIPMKEWVMTEAERLDLSPAAIYRRIKFGKYPDLRFETNPNGTRKRMTYVV